MQYVIDTLSSVIPGCNTLKAESIAVIVHNKGKCQIYHGNLKESIYLYAQLIKYGLHVSVQWFWFINIFLYIQDMTKTNIIVNLQVDGLHSWPDARRVFPEVGFLADVHRHMFHVQLKKRVTHDDRDVEFIMFKRDVLDYLHLKYFRDEYNCHFFGAMSCEMIAKELMEYFDCVYVSVYEDAENGAECYVEHL
jgi:hypothetical protein